jgi:hypothetical protein
MDPQDVQLEFEALENQRQVLGPSFSTLSGPPAENHEDEGISELTISKSHMLVRLRSVQSGAYNDLNAVLVIFDVTFQPFTPEKYRFKSARFEITFQGQKEILPYSSTPQVLSFAPISVTGEITKEKKDWHFTTGVTASVPLVPVTPEINMSVSTSSSYTTDHRMVIQGASRPPSKPFRVWWTLNEKKLVKEGLPHNCAFAAIVSYDGPFFATFKTEAQVGSGSISRSIISKKEVRYTKLIDPQRPLGPQFACDGRVDLKKLDINSRYQNTLGTSFGRHSDSSPSRLCKL